MSDKSKIYGATVINYTPVASTDVKRKIFYVNSSNIYLIAHNYVECGNLPNSTNGKTATTRKPDEVNRNYARAAYFGDILNDYTTGSARITDSRLKALNNDYFNTKKFTSTNSNMKSVAYMLDTTAWNSKFKDTNNKTDYVIGGPSVELLFKSYNEKYGTAYESRASSETGYQIRKTSSDSWSTGIRSMLTTSDSLYVIRSQSDACAMWVASPSAISTYSAMYANYYGRVSYSDYYNNIYGFRPVVCLQSNVTLEKVSDMEYKIVD